MPPQTTPLYHPLVIPLILSKDKLRMTFRGRKLIPLLVLVLATFSILRFLKVSITTSPLPLPSRSQPLQSPGSTNLDTLTEKEFKFMSSLIARKAPCSLLVFGLKHQYLLLAEVNAGGTTMVLEFNSHKANTIKTLPNSTRIYKVQYNTPSTQAYGLLRDARTNPACTPGLGFKTNCQLALTGLPRQVYEHQWDVVLVDGPSGESPEAPGRMAVIYTAALLARTTNTTTNVVVHDVERTIEKWYSWEFLCDHNLVSSIGRLWNFGIKGQSNSTTFCNTNTIDLI